MDMNNLWSEFDLNSKKQNTRCLSVNTILAGKYLVGPVLGQGGFGITYAGFDLNMETRIAIKEYFPVELVSRDTTTMHGDRVLSLSGEKSVTYKQGLKKYVEEAQNVSQFSGVPGIVSVKDFFYENETAYIVMEYIAGQSLKDYLKSRGGRLSEEETLKIMKPVLEALEKVHQAGIIHRDISPDNIMLTFEKDGRIKEVKLIDFGAARMTAKNDQKSLTIILKHGYAPEEQYRTHGEQGPWTDVYAVCAVLYRMLTGETPTPAMDRMFKDELKSFEALGVKVSQNTEAAILKGLAVKKDDRIQSMRKLIAALYEGAKLKGNDTGKRKVLFLAAGICAVLVIAVAVMALTGNKKSAVAEDESLQEAGTEQETDTENVISGSETMELQAVEEELGEQIVWPKKETMIATGYMHMLSLREDGTVLAIGDNSNDQCKVSDWEHIAAVYATDYLSAGLRTDGTVVLAGSETLKEGVSSWKGIVSLALGNGYVLGLTEDGHVVSAGDNRGGRCDTGDWTDISSIWICGDISFGITSDGKLQAAGELEGQEEVLERVKEWSGLKQIVLRQQAEATFYGLKEDGTILCAGQCEEDMEQLKNWTQVTWLTTGDVIVAGLREDGTVYTLGNKVEEAKTWNNMAAINATYDELAGLTEAGEIWTTEADYIGNSTLEEILNLEDAASAVWSWGSLAVLREDGTVKSVGISQYNRGVDASTWPSVIEIKADDSEIVGITSDHKVFREEKDYTYAAFDGIDWQEARDLAQEQKEKTPRLYNSWSDVQEISCSSYHIAALLGDGTVLAAGYPERQGDDVHAVDYETGLTKDGACDVESWSDIRQILAQNGWTVGLKNDGTLVCTDKEMQEKLKDFTGIRSIWGNETSMMGIKEDGTVENFFRANAAGQSNTAGWTDMVQLSLSDDHTVGLKSDGTVLAAGDNTFGQCDVEEWTGVASIAAGETATVGITSDGKVLMAGVLPDDLSTAETWSAIALEKITGE